MSENVPTNNPLGSYVFNPNEHLMDIKNRGGSSKYLPVQWRLVWFRSLFPQGTIETEILHLDLDRETEEEIYAWNNDTRRSEKVVKRAPGFAVFRATVRDGLGGIGIGTKSEKAASFGDFLEKAETGAIGRALAALGYGTQFCGDEFDEKHRIVDAPVDRGNTTAATLETTRNGTQQQENTKTTSSGRSGTSRNGYQKPAEGVNPQEPMTEQQKESIRKLCEHLRKAVPDTSTMNYLAAKDLIAQLSQEYRQSRSKTA